MKGYAEFNYWVLQRFIERNIPNKQGILCFDDSDWKESGYENLKFPLIATESWYKLYENEPKYNIPLYFGLIALQTLAATLVEDNLIIDKFKEIAGLNDYHDFQVRCRERCGKITIQDKLWISAKNYLASHHKIIINIPSPKNFRDRYIQYPKSQVVLNRDDLKEYINPFFDELINKYSDQSIDLNTFQEELDNHQQTFKRKNNKNANRTAIEEQIKVLQIFSYFNSRSWKNLTLDHNIRVRTRKSFILFYNASNDLIRIIDSEENNYTPQQLLFDKNYVFFKEHDVYKDEFHLVSYLEDNQQYILLCKNEIANLIKRGNPIGNTNKRSCTYIYISSEEIKENIYPNFRKEFRKINTITIEGLRIGSKNIFLERMGPKIINLDSDPYKVYYNNNIIRYDLNDCRAGKYKVQKTGCTDIHFEVVETQCFYKVLNLKENLAGIRLDNLRIDNEGKRLVGFKFLDDTFESNKQLTINRWIKINSKFHFNTHNKNLFLNLIKKYGD